MTLHRSIAATRLIHENIATLMMFAYSRRILVDLVDAKFVGEWKHLNKALLELPIARANKALVELAVMIRLVDDGEGIAESLKASGYTRPFGQVEKQDGTTEPLFIRDLSNKIMHARDFSWSFSDDSDPAVICMSARPDRWISARIDLVALASFSGMLIS